jgi:hypothetical protein
LGDAQVEQQEMLDGHSDHWVPLIWILPEPLRSWLARGRRCQLAEDPWRNFETGSIPSKGKLKVLFGEPTLEHWEVLPHPIYLWPLKMPNQLLASEYAIWCHLLLFFTAVTGDERLHDRLLRTGTGVIPFEERWQWRHWVHVPPVVWQVFERLSRRAMGRPVGPDEPQGDAQADIQQLLDALEPINASRLSAKDYRWERVDIALETDNAMDRAVAISPCQTGNSLERRDQDGGGVLTDPPIAELFDEFHVRIGQVSAKPDLPCYAKADLQVTRAETQDIMRQVWSVFFADSRIEGQRGTSSDQSQGFILLPEATIPNTERQVVTQLAQETGRAVLAGCLWRKLPTVVRPHKAVCIPRRYIVNEAILAAPLYSRFDDADQRPLVRQFTVRKPIPTHSETALAQVLTDNAAGNPYYRMLPGERWYRFVHPQWGAFTVAICADLLDPTPYQSLRGEIQHILVSAFNPDVDLYDAMTWVRAYENYCNVVQTNHGCFGGSFAWTPRHRNSKEVTKLRGSRLFLIADVSLPVKDLASAQRSGLAEAVNKNRTEWTASKPDEPRSTGFKSVPAGWPGS